MLVPLGASLLLAGCGEDNPQTTPRATAPAIADSETGQAAINDDTPQAKLLAPATPGQAMDNHVHPQFNVERKQYLFDISNQSQEQLLALLKRADEINTVAAPEFGQLNIILILDGVDIGWFLTTNYEKNKTLVDLAARLDALKVVDIKVSEQAMQEYGYPQENIPAFIDRVPYTANERQRLQDSGYFLL